MKKPSSKTIWSAVVGMGLLAINAAILQLRSHRGLQQKIERLEERVAKLERRVLASPWPTAAEAQRRIILLEARLRGKERLFAKGYEAASEVEAARFALQRAKKELELARAAENGKKTVGEVEAELDLLDAQHRLDVAKGQLEMIQPLVAKGFAKPDQVYSHRLAVEEAQRRLEHAKARLKNAVGEGDQEK